MCERVREREWERQIESETPPPSSAASPPGERKRGWEGGRELVRER